MGKHFDSLVEIVNKQLIKRDIRIEYQKQNIRLLEHLKQILNQAALFEFPIESSKLKELILKEKESYVQYLNEHFKLSAENREVLARPFEITAIEDPRAINIMVPLKKDKFRLINYARLDDFLPPIPKLDNLSILPMPESIRVLLIGDLGMIPMFSDEVKHTAGIGVGIDIKYKGVWIGNKFISKRGAGHPLSNHPFFEFLKYLQEEACIRELEVSTISYVQSTVYIMDPDNFIIERESKESRAYTRTEQEKPEYRRNKKIRKTAIRPHYIIKDGEALSSMVPALPAVPGEKRRRRAYEVRKHKRTFKSDYYVNVRGKTILIAQHWRGLGTWEDSQGRRYQVFLKKGTKLEPADEARK